MPSSLAHRTSLASLPRRFASAFREHALMYAGVALLFSPIGVLVLMLQPQAAGWMLGLVACAVSGVIALTWAACFQTRQYWMLLLVAPLSFIGSDYIISTTADTWIGSVGLGLSSVGRRAVLAILIILALSVGFTFLVQYIARSERRGARAKAELDLASTLHAHLVPDIAGSNGPIEYVARSLASTEMGGDLIDVREGLESTDFFIADVSGHGVKAGLVMGMVKAGLRMRAEDHAGPRSLATTLDELNRMLEQVIQPGMFVTAACVRVLHPSTDTPAAPTLNVEYALAGHPPILIYRATTRSVDQLPNDALPLGLDSEQRIASAHVRLQPGDILMLFTDGLNETMAPASSPAPASAPHSKPPGARQLGIDGLATLFATRAAQAANTPLTTLHENLLTDVREFGPQSDDRSLVLVRVV